MALYPLANKRLIAPGHNDPPIKVIGAILHVDAGDNASLYNYFKDKSGGIESHFHVPKAGPIEQYRDTGFEADANLKANSFMKGNTRYGYVSIETQGKAAGTWNAHQVAQIKALLKWLSETHDFPLRKCPSHTASGVGYHVMFGAPGPWTPVAKSCPGPDRVRQFNTVFVPWFTAGHAPSPSTPGGAVTPEEKDLLDKIFAQVVQNGRNITSMSRNLTVLMQREAAEGADAKPAAKK